VTLGDPNGIGPEVVAKSVRPFAARCAVILIGPPAALRRWRRFLGAPPVPLTAREARTRRGRLHKGLYLIDPGTGIDVRPGRMTRDAARAAIRSFEIAIELLKAGPRKFALVTAPVSKEACLRAGFPFTGHTGDLGRAFRQRPLMLLMAGRLRVALVTEHIPLHQVPSSITAAGVLVCLRILAHGLFQMGGVPRPHIAVLGLNPHAGEGGRIGTEDRRIAAAVRAFNRSGPGRAEGPIPADAAFAPHPGRGTPDAYLAMYHDQGLIAVKREGVHRAVNLTLGLPAVRTSPAHGTAFDIAGKDRADPRSLRLALRWALRLAERRIHRPSAGDIMIS